MHEQYMKIDKEIATSKKKKKKLQTNKNPRAEKYNNWTEKFNRVSKVDLTMQKKESATWKIEHWKFLVRGAKRTKNEE